MKDQMMFGGNVWRERMFGGRECLEGMEPFRASSYEPVQPCWLGFRDFASPLFRLPKNMDVFRSRAGQVTEISVVATEISVAAMKNSPHEHSSLDERRKPFRQHSFALSSWRAKWRNFCFVCELPL